MKNNLLFLLMVTLLFSCNENPKVAETAWVNSSHLDHLYQEVLIDKKPMAIIHIYCEYPDYKWVDDADEGISCIDDVARAGIFYLRDYKAKQNEVSLHKAKNLIRYVLHLQSDNGYFYNFVFPDYSINKTGKTSINTPNWWSWRAGWILTESLTALPVSDSLLADSVNQSLDKLFAAVKKDIPKKYETKVIGGFVRPDWLLLNTASDQTAILLLSLKPYAELKNDNALRTYADKLAEGMLMMQVKSESTFLDGAFLSWENSWHAWGNTQSYALLNTGFSNENHDAALYEINHFYKTLSAGNYWNELSLEKKSDSLVTNFKNRYDQIAYGIRPMVLASMKAYELTGDSSYAEKAAQFATWLTGKNIANKIMYESSTGRGFDGIRNDSTINMNSGAESTIEALLSIQAVENNPVSKKYFERMNSEMNTQKK